jgi:Mg2+-importing ATPase
MKTKHLLNAHLVEKVDEVKNLATMDWAKLFHLFATSEQGLSAAQAQKNLKIFGPNQLDLERRNQLIIHFFKLLFTPLSVLLIVLSAVSYLTGESRGAVVIASMVFLSTLLSFVQEHKSNRAAEKLKAMVSTRVTVIRDGLELEIEIADLVPGDLIHLSVGDLIPADLRLVDSKGLFVNEGSLTGESLPVEKNHIVNANQVTSIFDWVNLCHMGSHVVSGTAHAIVLKTGRDTFFGELAKETTEQKNNRVLIKALKNLHGS